MNPDLQRSKARVALLSVVSNFSLVLLKLVVGLMIGSVSVISEAIHSGVDLMAALIALLKSKAFVTAIITIAAVVAEVLQCRIRRR